MNHNAQFERLWNRYGAIATKQLKRATEVRKYDDFADLLQQTKIKALRNLGSLREEATFCTWFVMIGKRIKLDNIRGRDRRPPWCSIDREIEGDHHGSTYADILPDPDDFVRHILANDAADKIMDVIPYELRRIVRMTAQDMTYMDIAEAEGIPEGTVKSRLHRARREAFRALAKSKVLVEC